MPFGIPCSGLRGRWPRAHPHTRGHETLRRRRAYVIAPASNQAVLTGSCATHIVRRTLIG